jgi:shikimate kinase
VKILICGFMGAGKSTLLAKFDQNSLGFECLDLDVVLSKKLGIAPDMLGSWVEQNGWEKFRKFESDSLLELTLLNKDLVIALGGGTLTGEMLNHLQKQAGTYLIHLDVPLEVCLNRVKGDLNRPLLKMKLAELENLYKARHEYFSQAHLSLTSEEINLIDGLETLVHNLTSR